MATTWTLKKYQQFTNLNTQLHEALEKAEKVLFEKELTYESPKKYLVLLFITTYNILTGEGATAEDIQKLSELITRNLAYLPSELAPYTAAELLLEEEA